MSEAQTIGEAVRSANETLTAKPESREPKERQEPKERDVAVKPDTQRDTAKPADDDDFGAPKWTKQWKKPTREALRKLYANEEAKALLPDILKEVEDRYDYTGKTQAEYDRLKKRFDPYEPVLGSLEQRFALQGVPPAAGIQQMAAVADLLQQNPDQGLAYIAQMFRPRDAKAFIQSLVQNWGVDLESLAAQAPWTDPAVKQLVEPLQQQVQALSQQNYMAQQQQFQYAQQQVYQHLQAFRNAKDEQGESKYPHAQRLEPVMAQIAQATGNFNLDQLYNQALWLDPELREGEIENRARKAEAKAIQDAKAKSAEAEEAVRASRNVNGTTRAPAKQKSRDLSETIRQVNKRLTS